MRPRLRWEVLQRDRFTCRYCGRQAPDVVLHVDHVEPRLRGGGDDLNNLVTACQTCNLGKSASSSEVALRFASHLAFAVDEADFFRERLHELRDDVDQIRDMLINHKNHGYATVWDAIDSLWPSDD